MESWKLKLNGGWNETGKTKDEVKRWIDDL